MVLRKIHGRILAVNPAARRVEYVSGSGLAHRLQDVLGQIGPLPKVDIRLGDCFRYVRIRCEMKDRVATIHGFTEPASILQIGLHHGQPAVARLGLEIASLSGSKVVINNYFFSSLGAQKPPKQMAADKPGAARNERFHRFRPAPPAIGCSRAPGDKARQEEAPGGRAGWR